MSIAEQLFGRDWSIQHAKPPAEPCVTVARTDGKFYSLQFSCSDAHAGPRLSNKTSGDVRLPQSDMLKTVDGKPFGGADDDCIVGFVIRLEDVTARGSQDAVAGSSHATHACDGVVDVRGSMTNLGKPPQVVASILSFDGENDYNADCAELILKGRPTHELPESVKDKSCEGKIAKVSVGLLLRPTWPFAQDGQHVAVGIGKLVDQSSDEEPVGFDQVGRSPEKTVVVMDFISLVAKHLISGKSAGAPLSRVAEEAIIKGLAVDYHMDLRSENFSEYGLEKCTALSNDSIGVNIFVPDSSLGQEVVAEAQSAVPYVIQQKSGPRKDRLESVTVGGQYQQPILNLMGDKKPTRIDIVRPDSADVLDCNQEVFKYVLFDKDGQEVESIAASDTRKPTADTCSFEREGKTYQLKAYVMPDVKRLNGLAAVLVEDDNQHNEQASESAHERQSVLLFELADAVRLV